MNSDKSDFWKGFTYFCILMICIFSWFTTPDGDTVFYKFIGLFGMSPGIQLGNSSTLYIYMLIPLIAGILCIRKTLKYWHGYGLRFKEYNVLMRFLPMFTVIPVLLFSNIVTPTLLERLYFAVISQRNGLQAVTYYAADEYLSFEFTGNYRTYSYNFAFGNHSNETIEFNVKLSYQDMSGLKEVFIKDDNGEMKEFTIPPNQITFCMDEFAEYSQTIQGNASGSGRGTFSVVLVNDDKQYSPKPLTKLPLF